MVVGPDDNLSCWEVEAGGPSVLSHLQLQSEFEDSLVYVRLHLKTKQKEEEEERGWGSIFPKPCTFQVSSPFTSELHPSLRAKIQVASPPRSKAETVGASGR